MNVRRDEWPIAAIVAVSRAVSGEMDDRIADHERRLHSQRQVAPPPRAPFKAYPHKERNIPGEDLERMVELIETGEENVYTLAASFGYPVSLVERELADHRSNWREHVRARAAM